MSSIKVLKGLIYSIRRGSNARLNHALIVIPGIESIKELQKFVGKKVVWKSRTGKLFVGRVKKVWNRKGDLLVIFRKGLPGQALGTEVEIIMEQNV
ncbi:MAG: 50S ribosomal protein L35 [Thermoprotei archaeon ex4572_64]|nr:MAG: 50S ribosomal protein L35 [Thermoprotei archaeon ex4572_64]